MRAHDASRVLPWLALLAAIGAFSVEGCGEEIKIGSTTGAASGGAGSPGSGGAGGTGGGGVDVTTGSAGGMPEAKCSPAPALDGNAPGPVPAGAAADFALPGTIVRVAMGPDGDAAVAVIDHHEISVRRYVGGQWKDVERIAAPEMGLGFGELSVGLAAGPSGRVLVVYAESIVDEGAISDQYAICARSFDPGSGWAAPELLGVSNEGWWQDPKQPDPVAAMNGNGDAVVAWSGNPSHPDGIFARRSSPGSGFGPLDMVTKDSPLATTLALHDDGSAVVGWSTQTAVESRASDSNANWGAIQDLAQFSGWLRLSVGLGGSTVALWSRYSANAGEVVETATRSPMGTWSAPETLATDPSDFSRPMLAVTTTGFGIGAWNRWSAGALCYGDPTVRVLGANGVWQPESPVPKLNEGPSAIFSLSASNAGRAVVAWERYEVTPCDGKGMNLSWFDAATASWSYEELDPSVSAQRSEVALSPGGRALIGWEHEQEILVRWADPPAMP